MLRSINRALALGALITSSAVAACSGGMVSAPTLDAGTTRSAANGTATLAISRYVPADPTTSSSKRRPNEVSFGANSLIVDSRPSGAPPSSAPTYHAVFDISGAVIGTGLSCSTDVSGIYQTCRAQIRLPLGANTLTVATNSARDGSGTTLGNATISVTINDQQDNPIAMTLDGAVASMRLAVQDPSPPIGVSANYLVSVQLYDASGVVLIAPQNYVQPVTVSVSDTSAATSLFTQQVQNSTQRFNGTPVSSTPSPRAKTVSVLDRYTQVFLGYNGASTPAFTLTGTMGTLSSTITVSPAVPASPTPAPAVFSTNDWPAGSPRGFDPLYDGAGNLWVTRSGGSISSVSTTTYQPTATYQLGTAGSRSLRSPVLGPDGALWSVSATVSNGAAVAPFFVTRFDASSHAFTDYPAGDQVMHLVVAAGGLWGAERNSAKLWHLPFSGTTAGAASTIQELPLTPPPVSDTTPALLPLPTRIFPTTDGNLWVTETSYAAADGAWIAKVSPGGAKLSETMVVPGKPALALDAQALDAAGRIWFADLSNANEFVRYDPSGATATQTFVVPRLYGANAVNEFTSFATVDGSGNLWFVSNLDGRLGRVNGSTGRIDFFTGPSPQNNLFGGTIAPDGTYVVLGSFNATTSGTTTTTPFVYTIKVQ